jgi:hypothetical protein
VAFDKKRLGQDSEVAFELNIVFDECGELMLEEFEFGEVFFLFELSLFVF